MCLCCLCAIRMKIVTCTMQLLNAKFALSHGHTSDAVHQARVHGKSERLRCGYMYNELSLVHCSQMCHLLSFYLSARFL